MSIATLEPLSPPIGPVAERRRLLLVAYNFPPVGGAGVQRPVKWTKYLGRFGWDVTVLTTLNPSVPVRDESLLADIPESVTIARARTYEPSYQVKQKLISATPERRSLLQALRTSVRGAARRGARLLLQPDPQVLWNPDAIRMGSRLLREQRHDAILVTAPAYSSLFIGTTLKRRFGLPVVFDFRDEWDLSGQYLENAHRDWFSRTVQARMQRRLLRQADAVLATTQLSTRAYADRLESLRHPVPAHCIYNGYDEEDFADRDAAGTHGCDVMQPARGSFRLVYTGTLWNLTDIAPLVRGIEHLNRTDPSLVRKLELVCVGRKTPEQQAVLNRLRETSATLISIDYCDHQTALQWLRSAGGLCLLLSDVPGAERVVPAKLFEYLAIQKDMLAICPAGETADIARRFCPDGHVTPSETSRIADWLKQRLASGGGGSRPYVGRDEFSRETQTRRLAEILDSLVPAKNVH